MLEVQREGFWVRYYQYDANGNLVSTDDSDTSTPGGGSGGGGAGTPGKDGRDGSIIYSVNFEPVPGQAYTGYNPQDLLLSPSSTLYPLQTA